MIAIFWKEINLFFSSLIGYITLGVFLLVTSLFLWVLPQFNILNGGYATLDGLFTLAPFIFWFLIPALTMRTFAEERKAGTLELLSTKPVSESSIVFGKFLAGLVLVIINLIPTLLSYFTLRAYAVNPGDIDTGAIAGSYIGLILLGGVYLSIGILASSLTENQIVAFIAGMVMCFIFYSLFDILSDIPSLGGLRNIFDSLSLASHYRSVSRGVLDTRDMVYFLSLTAFFLLSTKTVLAARRW